MTAFPDPELLEFVRGDTTGLAIPAHAAALRSAGAEFLTQAFHAFGSIAADNRVERITRCESFSGGNSGDKLILSVDYAREEPGLDSDLFVKFSRDFVDAFRDRRRYELESEVRLAGLSRLPTFPVAAPVPYFADFHHESGTGLVIMRQILFNTGTVEPHLHKCMDHELADPLAYYRPIVTSLARLAAAHKSGRLSPQVEQLFPFDARAAAADIPIPCDEPELRLRLARFADFAQSCPQLLPPGASTAEFIATFQRDALRFLHHEKTVKRFLHANPDFIALCHWNANIDNVWFWRDAAGVRQCGLLDWGMVRQMNMAYSLWSCLSMTTLEVWNEHLDELLALYIRTLGDEGGPALKLDALRLHLDLTVAVLGLALMSDAPALLLSRMPDIGRASGPLDPILHRDSVVRGFLQGFRSFLNLWATHDFGGSLDRMLEQVNGKEGLRS
jgi:hypothetical protein